MRRILLLGATAGMAMALVAACVGDEPPVEVKPSPEAGTTTPEGGADAGGDVVVSSDAGDAADAATAELPIIDQYSIGSLAMTGTFAECVNAVDTAVKGMGGGYVAAGTSSSFSRYGSRPGAVVSGSCIAATTSVLLSSWAIEGGADTTNDELRLSKLFAAEVAPAVSPAKASLPEIRAEMKIHSVAAIPISTCLNRAEKAMTKLLDLSPVQKKRWTSFTGSGVRAAGVAGTSASISCIGNTGTIQIDVFTVDPGISTTTTLVNSLVTEFNNAT